MDTVRREEKIQKQKEFTRKSMSGKKTLYPLMEVRLHKMFLEMRKEGKSCKKWWFMANARKLMAEWYPAVTTFRYSDRWFGRFRQRYGISWRRRTARSSHQMKQA